MAHLKKTLSELRDSLTENQREILSEIWRYWSDEGKITSAIALYNKFEKTEVESSLESLGGSVVFRSKNSETGRAYYQLTFLGTLLSDRGMEIQTVMEKYLGYLHNRLKGDPELNAVSDDDLRYGARLSKERRDLLKKILTRSPFWNGNSGVHDVFTVPRHVDELAVCHDVHAFFEKTALEDYDPHKPLDWSWQSVYSPTSHRQIPDDMRYDVFLSYASSDQPEALEIYEAIKTAGGSVFLAVKNLKAGDDFAKEIRKALKDSQEVWLLVSPNSLKSEWVISEWGAAWALEKRIVPILFHCVPSELPDRLQRLHAIDFNEYAQLVDNSFSKKGPR